VPNFRLSTTLDAPTATSRFLPWIERASASRDAGTSSSRAALNSGGSFGRPPGLRDGPGLNCAARYAALAR
jgi:hypothetical protein